MELSSFRNRAGRVAALSIVAALAIGNAAAESGPFRRALPTDEDPRGSAGVGVQVGITPTYHFGLAPFRFQLVSDVSLSGAEVLWSCLDPSILSVDLAGNAQPITTGPWTVVASFHGSAVSVTGATAGVIACTADEPVASPDTPVPPAPRVRRLVIVNLYPAERGTYANDNTKILDTAMWLQRSKYPNDDVILLRMGAAGAPNFAAARESLLHLYNVTPGELASIDIVGHGEGVTSTDRDGILNDYYFNLALGRDEALLPLDDFEIEEVQGTEGAKSFSPERFAAVLGGFLAPAGHLRLCSCFSDDQPPALEPGPRKRLTQALADALGGQRTVEGYEGLVEWTEAPIVDGQKDYKPPSGVRNVRTPTPPPPPDQLLPDRASRMAGLGPATRSPAIFDALGRRRARITGPGIYFLRWMEGPTVRTRRIVVAR